MWNSEAIKKLIELYESHTVLWDVSSPDYKNKYKKQSAVRNIAETLNLSEDNIKKKIHHLRTQFLQEVRRIKQKKRGKGSAENYSTKWEFFNALKFIIGGKEEKHQVKNLELNESLIDAEVTIREELPSTSKLSTAKKRKRDEVDTNVEDQLIKKATSLLVKPFDDHQVFGDFVASELRLLKSHKNKVLLRRKIQRAILEVSEIDSADTYSSSDNV